LRPIDVGLLLKYRSDGIIKFIALTGFRSISVICLAAPVEVKKFPGGYRLKSDLTRNDKTVSLGSAEIHPHPLRLYYPWTLLVACTHC